MGDLGAGIFQLAPERFGGTGPDDVHERMLDLAVTSGVQLSLPVGPIRGPQPQLST